MDFPYLLTLYMNFFWVYSGLALLIINCFLMSWNYLFDSFSSYFISRK